MKGLVCMDAADTILHRSMPTRPRLRDGLCAAVACLIVGGGAAYGLERVEMDIGAMESALWSASGITFSARIAHDARLHLDVTATRVELPPPFNVITAFNVRCSDAVVARRRARCVNGRVQLTTSIPGVPDLSGDIAFDYGDDAATVRVTGLQIASGRAEIFALLDARRWRLDLKGERVSARSASELMFHLIGPMPTVFKQGDLWLEASVEGSKQVTSVDVSADVRGLSFSDQQGLRAGENVDLNAAVSARRKASDWTFETSIIWKAGEAYFEPIYLRAPRPPLRANLTGSWHQGHRTLELSDFDVRHPGLGEFRGALSLEAAEKVILQRARAASPRVQLKGIYDLLLQPYLVGSVADNLEIGGHAAISMRWSDDGPGAARVVLDDVSVDDRKGRFGVDALNGEANWAGSGETGDTRLSWKSAYLYRVDLGGGKLNGDLRDRDFRLRSPLNLPVLDGDLRIEDLVVSGIGSPKLSWRFQGGLNPVSMERVSVALGWPSMGGTLSGAIPAVRYTDGEITVDGTLAVRVFDGLVKIRNVRLIRPFGIIPVLSADVDMTDIALDALTRAFSFGKIQGRLEGHIHDLILENWRPRSLDARFATPAGDRSRHRISQRAVDNLAKLGGAGGVVSKTFLRFFSEFSYDRIGLSCRLRRGVCEMGGVDQADNGFYIVKGGGLPPRIDVLGYNRQVDWNTLVERLKGITRAEAPIIR